MCNKKNKFTRKQLSFDLLLERLRAWWRNGPINPVFLTIRDDNLKAVHVKQVREVSKRRLKILTISLWSYLALYSLIHIGEYDKHFIFMSLMGSGTLVVTLVWLITRCHLAFCELTSLIVVVTQSLVTFLLFHFISTG